MGDIQVCRTCEKSQSLDFCYWLQGFFEISEPKTLSEREMTIIRDHLQLGFEKKTPDRKKGILWDQQVNKMPLGDLTKPIC